jgi:sulfatase maturation enzyme AslB (radical SAM superfamily)
METYVVHVTNDCNCACLYCYERGKHTKDSNFTVEEVEKYVRQVIESTSETEFGIEFLGGEPMLNFEGIKAAVALAETYKNKSISYTITTNGTLLPEGFALWLRDHERVRWATSMDGTKWSNQLRVFADYPNENTYGRVKSNFHRLHTVLESVEQLSIHMVTHLYNVYLLAANVEHLYAVGVRSIGIGTIETTMTIDAQYERRFVTEMATVSAFVRSHPDLHVDILDYLKPATDQRTYIYDEQGKWIGETYGRAQDDLTHHDGAVKSVVVGSPIGDRIQRLRSRVYEAHQKSIERTAEVVG